MGAVLPLLALRAFVETARHGNLTRAAAAMGVTPGAVSQQLRALQARTGVVLFQRFSHGMRLTPEGEQVYPGLRQAFEQITASLAQLEAINARQTITVSTEPSFAATWLVPRLGQFSASHPQVEVRVEATALLADLRRERIDVAIRHGLGDYPGLDVQALMAPPLIPVASPRLLAEGPEIREAIDCLAYPLLQESERNDWRLWLRAMGVEDDPRSERGPAFADDLLLVRAAEAGQGIALVREIHARAEIASGRLAVALERPWPSRFAYYAVSLPGAAQRAPLSLFLAWLREQPLPRHKKTRHEGGFEGRQGALHFPLPNRFELRPLRGRPPEYRWQATKRCPRRPVRAARCPRRAACTTWKPLPWPRRCRPGWSARGLRT